MLNRTISLGLVIAVSLMGADCGTGSASTRLLGAGSTFAYPLYSRWAGTYYKLHPDVEVDYQSLGSGAGIGLITEGRVDFGATDGPMTDRDMAIFAERRGCAVFHVPMALGADVPSYNLPGVTVELKFTPRALAGIYLGTIKKWNDPELTSTNAGAALPNADIAVVHRDDRSGTTYVWTDFLSKISDEWRERIGRGTSVTWPVGSGATGNQGVADLLKATPHAIGYVELTYAIREKLPYGQVQNPAGAFVKADLQSVTAAAADSADSMPSDFRVSITNAPGAHAYPVSSFTWALVPAKIADPVKKRAIVAFLNWGLTEGQAFTEPLSYARLPAPVVDKAKLLVAQIQ